ncbi:MAG TPA: DUF4336 domain-containing protein [Pseudorhizobium sp.]|nr:DUF4336 domain-containing protein [Pseudorhizobium sp.]
MTNRRKVTYPPSNTLKFVAKDLWIVDGPLIHFGALKMPFPTRMTIVRIAEEDLFIHSPTPLTFPLRREIEQIGQPRWIIAPNRIHYWWVPDWRESYPDAEVYLAPRVREQAADRITFDGLPLDRSSGYPWDADLATLPISGSYMTEVEFFHYRTRTLILTDLIENFELRKLDSFVVRWLTWLAKVQDPDGQMPRDMRLTFLRQRSHLRASVEAMIEWNPERVIVAHGRWYDRAGADELRRAFRWLLN